MATEQIDLYAPESKDTSDVVSFNVRMPRKLRDEFTAMCESRGIEASKVIRRFLERELQVTKMNDSQKSK